MFKEKKGGSLIQLPDAFGVMFDCWLPPLGYGYDPYTKTLARTDVIKRSHKKEDQYWEREQFPKWFQEKETIELQMQESDPDYVDGECEKIREAHWRRRLYGCWVYMNGVPTYLTGAHWLMLEHWRFQGKYLDYREPNRDFFYIIDYCVEDPCCLGDIEITKRKDGKTLRAGCLEYNYISRFPAKHGAIQSKSFEDAREVFKKAIVDPWKRLPKFFRPIYDTAAGDDPTSVLRFYRTSRKGKKKKGAATEFEEDALESFIDYKPSGVYAYDGPEVHWYTGDEVGKTKDISVVDRHNVNQFCSEVDGEYIGFHHLTTTVEEMESGGSEFQKLVKMSDRRELDGNGRTKTGLYVQFLPAYKTLFFDKYGKPDEVKAREYYMARRIALADNPRDLSSFIRKNPFTLAESFRVDGEKSLWNPEKLNEQLDWLSWHEDIVERGNFEWKDGERFTQVIWVKNKTSGRWKMPVGFKIEEANKVEARGGRYYPKNNHAFRIGCDPFKYDKAKDNRRSDCAFFAGKMLDPSKPNDVFNNARICRYRFRAATTALANEDLLKTCWFFGCQVLIERNVNHWLPYFIEAGCVGFLMKLDGEDEYGIYSDGQGGMLQAICDLIEDDIENNHKKMFFKETVAEKLEFDVGNTTAADETIADGITLVAMKKKQYKKINTTNNDVSRYFKRYKVNQ